MSRTAEEIGHTALGPRPLPPLGEQHVAAEAEAVDTVLDNGLRVLAVRRPAVPLVELRLRIPFGGTAVLIVVGVGLETVKQIESQLMLRNYEGFLR